MRTAETERGNVYTLRSPRDGTVTALQATPGTSAAPQLPLVSLRAANDPLVAELLIPTRAAGFIEAGQTVKVLYDAFPYQRFGIHSGTIERVSRSVYSPGQIIGPVQLEEPAYRAIVHIDEQGIDAFGERLPLQAGMILEADVVLNERRFIDVMLEPLLSVTGRI
ncbi:MAG: HlyD family efflux transporter periplasmic adaptor subunit [Pseudomonadota bacterium]